MTFVCVAADKIHYLTKSAIVDTLRRSAMEITRRVYFILLSLVAVWCGLIIAAPLINGVSESAGSLVYQFFSRICHQLDERSFHLAGGKFAVCIRCSAIYFAFFAGIVLYPFVNITLRRRRGATAPSQKNLLIGNLPVPTKNVGTPLLQQGGEKSSSLLRPLPSRRWLLLALLPMLVDVFLGFTGIHASTDITRLVTGSLFGVVLPWYILPVLFESLESLSKHWIRTSKGEPSYARKTE